jgi:hypothetical protein
VNYAGPHSTRTPATSAGKPGTGIIPRSAYCAFHHLICIHRWGWVLTGQAGQTLTVTSPDGTTVYRSHAPPARPAA